VTNTYSEPELENGATTSSVLPEAVLTQFAARLSDLRSRPRRGPNQLFLNRQLRPLLGLPKEEFTILVIVGPGRVPLALANVL
jgi:hypothetical protein